jgi:hypothetical protein
MRATAKKKNLPMALPNCADSVDLWRRFPFHTFLDFFFRPRRAEILYSPKRGGRRCLWEITAD